MQEQPNNNSRIPSVAPHVSRELFSPGTLVKVDTERRTGRPHSEGGFGYVTNESNWEEQVCHVKYTVNGLNSPISDLSRLHIKALQAFDEQGQGRRKKRNPQNPTQSAPNSRRIYELLQLCQH